MQNKGKYAVKICLFAVGFIFLWIFFTSVLSYKYGDDITRPDEFDSMDSEFEQLREDSVDVVFLGSSKAMSAYNPLLIWEEAGITSFNKGGIWQSYGLSYYYLLDTYRTQLPSVVVFEVGSYDYESTVFTEYQARAHIDNMKLSKVKLEAIKAMVENDDEQNIWDYLLPLLRYHGRWSELEQLDFIENNADKEFYLKGYAPMYGFDARLFEEYDYEQTDDEMAVISEENREYLNMIAKTCADNGSTLILVKNPQIGWTKGEHRLFEEIAEELQVDFIDYNDAQSGFVVDKYMFCDTIHVNFYGADVISEYMTKYITNNFEFSTEHEPDSQYWEECLAKWHQNWDARWNYFSFVKSESVNEKMDLFFSYLDGGNSLVIVGLGDYISDLGDKTKKLLIDNGVDESDLDAGEPFAISFYNDAVETIKLLDSADEPFVLKEETEFKVILDSDIHALRMIYEDEQTDEVLEELDDGITLMLYSKEDNEVRYQVTLFD